MSESYQKHATPLIEHSTLMNMKRNRINHKTIQQITIFNISWSPGLELPISDHRLSISRRKKQKNNKNKQRTKKTMNSWLSANSEGSRSCRISQFLRSGPLAYVHHKSKVKEQYKEGSLIFVVPLFSPSPSNVRVCTRLLIIKNSNISKYPNLIKSMQNLA